MNIYNEYLLATQFGEALTMINPIIATKLLQ